MRLNSKDLVWCRCTRTREGRDILRNMNESLARLTIAMFVACALVVSSCSGGDDDTQDPTTVPTETAESPTKSAEVTAASLCAGASASVAGAVASPDLIEISGLAASRTQDVIWAHNDSGDTPRVFAMSLTGDDLATYEVRGAEATDWEDMAIGPGPEADTDYLYLADIGDNASLRPEIVVYLAPEPVYDAASSLHAVDAEALRFVYPDGAHDAETLLVDPVSGDIIVVTKNIAGGVSGVYRAVFPQDAAVTTTLEKIAEIDFAALTPAKTIPAGSGALPEALGKIPTGGEISPDGSITAIRTYGTIWLWQRDGNSIAASFAQAPCEAPSAVETQGEAIAFRSDGRGYFTVSEGQNVALNAFALE